MPRRRKYCRKTAWCAIKYFLLELNKNPRKSWSNNKQILLFTVFFSVYSSVILYFFLSFSLFPFRSLVSPIFLLYFPLSSISIFSPFYLIIFLPFSFSSFPFLSLSIPLHVSAFCYFSCFSLLFLPFISFSFFCFFFPHFPSLSCFSSYFSRLSLFISPFLFLAVCHLVLLWLTGKPGV